MPLVENAAIEITTFGWVPPFARGQVRDLRVRWALEEVGLDYQVRTVGPIPPGYEREQPFGQVPAYREGDLQLFESGAIVQHIGEKDERLLPRDPVARARAIQWSYAALNSVEPYVMGYAALSAFYPDQEWAKLRKPSAREELGKRLGKVAEWLGDKQWLEGDRFSIGDLLMIAVLRIMGDEGGPVAEHPTLDAYRARGIARPPFRQALADQLALYADQPKGNAA
ncbi:glutathione S-transferase family protein [Sphingomonas sp. KRR8]|uniref:glutathione S-transferase family protein n=1 Tax=Sphingomonas sp. KRR8 TaxID=2942996 RepID=UPI00202034CA|nr:glutathione S-transferase family protein [Sphingomonas sp. KRR8]URD60021.1 glutathione S-transferase family protein [Sphingomonas sp. KRR8]